MQPFDFEHINKAGTVTNYYTIGFADSSGLRVSRDSVVTALRNHFCTRLNDGAAIDKFLYKAVIFEVRERILRVKIVVFPVCANNYSDGKMLFGTGIYDSAAEHPRPNNRRPERIAHSVNDPAGGKFAVLL